MRRCLLPSRAVQPTIITSYCLTTGVSPWSVNLTPALGTGLPAAGGAASGGAGPRAGPVGPFECTTNVLTDVARMVWPPIESPAGPAQPPAWAPAARPPRQLEVAVHEVMPPLVAVGKGIIIVLCTFGKSEHYAA